MEIGAVDFRPEDRDVDQDPAGEALKNPRTAGPATQVMKKIVLVSGNRIAPATTGGQVRTIGIARALARIGHSVHIFSTAGRREDYGSANLRRGTMENALEPRLEESTHLGLTFGVLQSLARRLDYPRVWQYHMLARGMIPKRLKRALGEADIVLSDLPYCPPIPGPGRQKPWYLISHNLEHKLLEQGSARQRRFASWMRDIEAAAPQTYTDILTCAEEDLAFFRAHDTRSRLKLPIVRCGVDPRLYSFSPQMRPQMRAKLGLTDEDRVLVFSGSGFAPNVEALREIKEFCHAEAQFLAASRVYLLVVGSVSSAAYRDGALIVTGPVPEVLPYFAASDAGLNLVTRGSGSNVKLFEYLAARLPVISTLFGVRGTELKAFEDYLPCSRDDLKETILRFIGSDRAFWRNKAQDVWNRHKHSCDIQDLINDAISVLPPFGS
jgi:glycosyltransferase involved in cell wall biosynthesis